MLKRRSSSRATITSPTNTYFSSSSSSLSSAATAPSPTFSLSSSGSPEDDDVQIIDVPLKARLRERRAAPEKKKKKRKKKRGAGEDDEFDEDDDESDDGNEDNVSNFSGSDDADEDDEDDDDDEDYASSSRRSTSSAQKGGGRPVTREEIAELKAVIGSHLSDGNYIQLIKNAHYDVNLAANTYFSQVGAGEEKEESKEGPTVRKQSRVSSSSLADSSLLSPPGRAGSRSSPRFSIASTSSASSASPAPILPFSSSSSSSAWPDVRKPSQTFSLDSKADMDDSDDEDRPMPAPRRGGWGWGRGGRGRARGGMKLFKGRKGKGMMFDPDGMSGAPRAADSTLPAHQRMSAYIVDMDVDVKMNNRWFPMVVTNVFETGHLIEVNHRDWPPECRQMVDPVSNRLAQAGSHEDDYYNFEQVDTYMTAPPKPPHPDAAKYRWPGETGEEEDEEAGGGEDSDLLMLLGTLKAKVVSDRPVGVKEFYDCLVAAEEGEEAERVWSVVSRWLRKQNKLVEIDEKIEEVKVRGQPTPSLSSAQGKRLQEKLHASRDWKIMERWQADKHDVGLIVRSHHKDTGDEDWKRSEVVDQMLEDMNFIARPGNKEVLLFNQMGANTDSSDGNNDSDDEEMGSMDDDDEDMSSDEGFSAFGLLGGLPFTTASRLARAIRNGNKKAAKQRKQAKGNRTIPDYMQIEAKQRPLHTYTITINIFLNLSAQRSSPATTALTFTPLNALMALLYPLNEKLQAMVKEAESEPPAPLRDSMKLDVLMSLSVRDEEGQPMYYETFKKREAERVKQEQEEKKSTEQAAKKKAAKRGGRNSNGRASSGATGMVKVEEQKNVEGKDEKDDVQDEPFMDIGVGEKEEELSVKCGLTITLRDYQCTTVEWMLQQEDEGSNTNMYLWSQLQFPQESLKFAAQRLPSSLSVSSSASASSAAASMTVPPLFDYCPLLQRFRFKPLPNLRGGWNTEEMGLGKTIGALAVINVQRRTPTNAEILATEEKEEDRQDQSRKKKAVKQKEDNSRSARYQRRQSTEQVTEEKEEAGEEQKEESKEEDELEGERVNDEHDDFPTTSSSPSASSSSSSSSPSSSSASSSPSAALPDTMDNLDSQGRILTSCTLVVCPVSLVGQWANELAEKSSRPLRILLYHGGSRPRKVAQLLNYDVIITSYGIAASELTLGNNRARKLIDKTPWLYKGKYAPEYQSLLNRLHWHRVILDESHVIRTMNSIQCRAAYELVGDRVWMLTGTVVNTSLMDLKGQARFLDMKGLSVGQVWTDIDNLLVQNKMYENRRADRSGKLRRTLLQKNRLKQLFVNLVTKSMIRHEKRQQFNGRPALISLPPKRVETIMVQPTADEKRAMDEMFTHAKSRFEQYKQDNVAVRRSVEVLQLLQPLRIACSGGQVDMVAHRERMKGELDRDAVRSVMDKVREKGSLTADKVALASLTAVSHLTDDCAICLDLLQLPLQTPCRHLFCAECIRGLLLSGRGAEKGTGQCPLCRADLSINQLYKPNVQEEVDDDEEKDGGDDEQKQHPVVRVKKEPGTVLKEKSGRAKKRKVVKSEESDDEDESTEEKKESASASASASNSDVVHFDSKLNKLMAELQAMRAASPLHKALVFTQYLSTMELLKRTMKEQDFTFQTLEGHMPMRQRKRNLEEFRANPECAVFLLSMRSGAVGLTLTAASHVFILEPAINPALEQQAIGRIHRLGNTHREVVVNYLVMAGSVEENLMEINREKLELLEKQKKREEDRLARANGMRVADEDDEDNANVMAAAGLDSDSENESAPAPRFGHHHTNANADSGAGINTVSQGSLVQDVALFRIGELDKLFKDRTQQAAAAAKPPSRAGRGKAVKKGGS